MTHSEQFEKISPIELKRQEFDRLAQGLEKYATRVTPEKRQTGAYRISFQFEGAVTTVRIVLGDYSGSDVLITNMTTLPDDMKSKGFGTQAIGLIKQWAGENNLGEIRATQVPDPDAQSFWVDKNGFVKDENNERTTDFLFKVK